MEQFVNHSWKGGNECEVDALVDEVILSNSISSILHSHVDVFMEIVDNEVLNKLYHPKP